MSTTSSPTHRRFDDDVLLDAARAVFSASGYHATQTSEIASVAGTTRPTLHARLGSKEQMYQQVLAREAHVFLSWIEAAYEKGREVPLDALADVGMEPLFRLAQERLEGFNLLFRGDRGGEQATSLRRSIVERVTRRLAALIEERQVLFGASVGPQGPVLAAACVGVAVQVCEQALDTGLSLREAHRIASQFVSGAFRGMVSS